MLLENKNTLIDMIQEAEYVVVGLGEEWATSFEEMLINPEISTDLVDVSKVNSDPFCIEMLKKKYYSCFRSEKLKSAYVNLIQLCKDKKYFVISLNQDQYPILAGFDSDKCVFPCGNYNYLQCASNCEDSLLDATDEYHVFLESLHSMVPYKTPTCPFCGDTLSFNIVESPKYCEGGYIEQWQAYMAFLQKTVNRQVCFIELGTSMRYPGIIRNAFEKNITLNHKAKLIRINELFEQVSEELDEKCHCLKENSVDYISNLFVS